jgi:hypothetical protein
MRKSREPGGRVCTGFIWIWRTEQYIRYMNLRVNKIKKFHVRFEVFTAVAMKNAVFWGVTPCDSCKNRCFGETYRLHHQGDMNRWARDEEVVFLRTVLRLLVTANGVLRSPILATLMMEALRSSETSFFTRATRRNIPEDGTVQEISSLAERITSQGRVRYGTRF